MKGLVRFERHALFAEFFEKPRPEGGDLHLVLLFLERHAFKALERAAEGVGQRHVLLVAQPNEVAFGRADAVQQFGHREDRTVVERDAALHLEPGAQTREAQLKTVKGKRRVPHDDRFAFGPLEHGFLRMCAHGVEKLERFAKRRIPIGVVLAHVVQRRESLLHRLPVFRFGLQIANDLQGFALYVEGDGFFAQTGPAHEPFLRERPNQRRDAKTVALRTHAEGDAGVSLLFLKFRRLLQKVREHGRAARETFEILRETRLRFGRKENFAALRCRKNFALLLGRPHHDDRPVGTILHVAEIPPVEIIREVRMYGVPSFLLRDEETEGLFHHFEAAIGVRSVEDALATDEFDQSLGWADRPKIFSVARVVDGLRHAQIAFVHLRRPLGEGGDRQRRPLAPGEAVVLRFSEPKREFPAPAVPEIGDGRAHDSLRLSNLALRFSRPAKPFEPLEQDFPLGLLFKARQ